MRVIAGSARSLPLKTVPGLDIRPTTDRIKETLFNMLGNDVYGCRFLDLFAGSGAIGIEALSRGAKEAVFVERDPRAVKCITQNLEFTHLGQGAQVRREDVFIALGRLSGTFDIVFLDPPYDCGLERGVLEALSDSRLADGHSLIIVEAALATSFDYAETLGFSLLKYKKYKTNAHAFFKKSKGSEL